jgi:hypothetical protein
MNRLQKRHFSLLSGVLLIFQCAFLLADDLKPVKRDSYSNMLAKTVSQCLTELKVAPAISQSDALKEATQRIIRSSDINFAISQDEALSKAFNDDSVTQIQFQDLASNYLNGLNNNFKASLNSAVSSIPPSSNSAGNSTTNGTADLLFKVTDIDPLKESTGLFQLNIKARDHFYPGGKPMTTNGFDKKTAAEQAEVIKTMLVRVFIKEIADNSQQYRTNIKTDDQKKTFENQWAKANSGRVDNIVAQIQSGNIKSPAGFDYLFGVHADFLDGFKTFLIDLNESYNNSVDNGIRGEDKATREKRLATDALKFVQQHLLLPSSKEIKSVEDLDQTSQLVFNQYLTRYSQPLIQGIPAENQPGTNQQPNLKRISMFKDKVFEIVRIWLRVQSFISLFGGGFGLDTAILDQVVKALETILGGTLSDAEKTEARSWATQLASEVQRPQPTTQPTTIPPVVPYPNTFLPVMPYGHGMGGHHLKNRMMIMPVPGGYYYFVR